MKPEVRTMLENTYNVFHERYSDSILAWDRFIEFIAGDHCPHLVTELDHHYDWFFSDKDLADKIIQNYNLELLHSDRSDHLGDMYIQKLVTKADAERRGLFLTPESVANLTAAMTIPVTEEKVTVLDPCVGSGRLLMAAHQRAPNGIFFGVDTDLRILRVAYTNLAIHGIKGYLLHADSLLHNTDISTEEGRENWKYSNHWNSHMDKLHKYSPLPKKTTIESKVGDPLKVLPRDQSDLFNPK